MRDRQEQSAGDNSTNLQAGGDLVFNAGLSVSDVIALTNETFRANLLQMRGIAETVYGECMERFLRDTVDRLATKKPESLQHAAEPDFQISLLEAAKAYGRSGDDDLEKLLVDILVARVELPVRSLEHIVLGEALTVAPKMTEPLMDALTVCWMLRSTTFNGVTTCDQAVLALAQNIGDFLKDWPVSPSSYQHLQYLGCGQVSVLGLNFDSILPHKFSALFDAVTGSPQTAAQEIRTLLAGRPETGLRTLPETWDNSTAVNFIPTAVGYAIAHANHRRKTGLNVDLSMWVN